MPRITIVHRLFDFVPLLLALALVVAYFTFSGQPIPFLQKPADETQAALRAVVEPTPTLRVPTRSPSPSNANVCVAARPRFVGGLARLSEAIGPIMGDALDCEVADGEGNTQQKTSKGLAYYRKSSNIAAFTTGWDHWALTPNGVVHWAGEAVEPPADAAPLS
jgi:hypothetical protein